MNRRLISIVFVLIGSLVLLYLQNKVYVGEQEFYTYWVDAGGNGINEKGGKFYLKDIAGKYAPLKDHHVEQFKHFIKRGDGRGRSFPIRSDFKVLHHKEGFNYIDFKFEGDAAPKLLATIKERLSVFTFSTDNEPRDLLYVPLGIDLRGGVEFICSLYDDDQNRVDADQQVVDILRTRLETKGLSEPQVSRLTNGDIQVVIPGGGKAEAARTRKVLETTGKLEFREVLSIYGDADNPKSESRYEPGEKVSKTPQGKWGFKPGGGGRLVSFGEVLYPNKSSRGEDPKIFYRLGSAKITGQDVKDGFVTQDDNGGPAVGINLDAAGGSKSFEWTRNIKSRGDAGSGSGQFAICLDGVVYSDPRIIQPTGAQSRITGDFTIEEVNSLVLVLDTGALSVKPEVLSERVIGATLGKETISKGLYAMLGSVATIMAFIVMYYRRLGVVAMSSLACTLALVWTAVSVFSVTMTLPGLAGLVLTIGMAVDANILIFERIREEIAEDIDIATSIDAGYARAFITIFDANVTTFLTAFVLSWIGTGAVQGFGNTLMIGIVTSMFGAIYVGRFITDALYSRIQTAQVNNALAKLPLQQPYVKWRFIAAIISALVVVIGLSNFVAGGSKHFAIDFTGGNMVQATLKEPHTLEEIRTKVAEAHAANPEKYDLLDNSVQILPYFSDFEQSDGGSRQFVFKGRDAEAIKINKDMAGLQEQLWAVNAERDQLLNNGAKNSDKNIKDLNRKSKDLAKELQPFKDKLAGRIEVFKGQIAGALGAYIIDENSEVLAASRQGERLSITLEMLSIPSATQLTQLTQSLESRQEFTDVERASDGSQLTISANYITPIQIDETYTAKQFEEAAAADALFARIAEKAQFNKEQALDFVYANVMRDFYDHCVDRAASTGLQVAAAYPASDHFSPQVAEQMKNKAYLALGFSILAILFYIAMRFELRYGFGAIIALVHDVLATVGILSLLGVRIDLTVVAALLTIVGYSLNDTIVVFDRIRENVQKFGKSMRDTIDGAIAQTMSRTILTSATTIFVIVILLIFGGDGVQSFSQTMLVGLILGTYSSVFVASPSLLLFKDPEPADETDDVVAGT